MEEVRREGILYVDRVPEFEVGNVRREGGILGNSGVPLLVVNLEIVPITSI